MLSVQANTLLNGTDSMVLTWEISCDSKWTPHNSSLGIVRRLIGATLVFEVIIEVYTFPQVSTIHK